MCVFEQGFFYKMDGIKKYSKEWFTLKATQADKPDVKKLAQGIKANSGKDIALDASVFVGTREAFNQKISIYERTGVKNEAAKQTYEAVKTYGADNIFNILDANNDGVIMPDEVKAVASLSEPDSPERMQMKFTTDDIETLYENALESVRAAVTEKGDDEIRIKYADGTKTTLKADENGVLETKLDEKKVDGRKQTSLFNYNDNTLTTTYYNKKHKIYKQTVDAEGIANDSVMNRTYNKDGSYKDVTKTVGKETVEKYNKNGKLVYEKTNVNYSIDGVIDDTKQKEIGDCWLLSGVNSMRETETGARIIKDSITQNKDGSVTVELKGLGKEYTFSAGEVYLAEYDASDMNYAKGDKDMNLLEMAIGEYRKELLASGDYARNDRDLTKTIGANATKNNPLEGGQLDEAIYFLTGVKSNFYTDEKNIKKSIKNIAAHPDKEYATQVSFLEEEKDVTGGKILTNHAYSVVSADKENVYVVNPWDSSKVIKYPRDKFLTNIKRLSQADLSKATV